MFAQSYGFCFDGIFCFVCLFCSFFLLFNWKIFCHRWHKITLTEYRINVSQLEYSLCLTTPSRKKDYEVCSSSPFERTTWPPNAWAMLCEVQRISISARIQEGQFGHFGPLNSSAFHPCEVIMLIEFNYIPYHNNNLK